MFFASTHIGEPDMGDTALMLAAEKNGGTGLIMDWSAGPSSYSTLFAPTPIAKWKPDIGDTALILAAENGYVNCLRVLLENPQHNNRADINYLSQEIRGRTALHAAATSGRVECVRYLLAQGARTNIKNGQGEIALECTKDKSCRALIQQTMEERGKLRSSMCLIS